MTEVIVGVDAGGTKCAVRVETVEGDRVIDAVYTAEDWEAEPADAAARWIRERVEQAVGAERILGIGVGAQGCDNGQVAAELEEAIGAAIAPAVVVNDAALLVPAAGLDAGFGLIAGTGSIAVGADEQGNAIAAGGWGWVIGDEGGAAALVREATKSALSAHDRGAVDDGLLTALLRAFDVADAERLARAVNDEPTIANWGPKAPAVFAAADDGSELAGVVIDDAAARLADLIDQVIARGGVGSTVVTAGSVIAGQRRLYDGFLRALARSHPELAVVPLDDEPVAGGIVLARRLIGIG